MSGLAKPAGYNFFIHLWYLYCPTLKIAERVSEFCDTCTALSDQLLLWTSRGVASYALNNYSEKAEVEFANLQDYGLYGEGGGRFIHSSLHMRIF